MFSSTFHVISGKFGLLFSQCTWRGDVEQLLHLPSSKNKCWKEGVFYCKITIKIQKKLFTFKFAKVGSVVWSIRSLWPLAPTQPEYSRNWASRNVFFPLYIKKLGFQERIFPLYITKLGAPGNVVFLFISQNFASRNAFFCYIFHKLCFQERIFPLYIYHKTGLPGKIIFRYI